jgi:hypothetical protein
MQDGHITSDLNDKTIYQFLLYQEKKIHYTTEMNYPLPLSIHWKVQAALNEV